MSWTLRLLFAMSFFWLAACATLPPQGGGLPPHPKPPTVAAMTTWDIEGVAGMRAMQGQGATGVHLRWQQDGQNYTIYLFGPLGADTVVLTGKPHDVTLKTAQGEYYKAASPEALLSQQTGWHLPVSYLYYWIRGLPVPHLAFTQRLDQTGRRVTLVQGGWTVTYLHYRMLDGLALPDKLGLEHPSVRIKISISRWQI